MNKYEKCTFIGMSIFCVGIFYAIGFEFMDITWLSSIAFSGTFFIAGSYFLVLLCMFIYDIVTKGDDE